MLYVFLCIKLFVNISLFVVQHDLNKIQINSTKKFIFSNQTAFPDKKMHLMCFECVHPGRSVRTLKMHFYRTHHLRVFLIFQ
jgi:hypothetical protein